jgi:hypothetical protein
MIRKTMGAAGLAYWGVVYPSTGLCCIPGKPPDPSSPQRIVPSP